MAVAGSFLQGLVLLFIIWQAISFIYLIYVSCTTGAHPELGASGRGVFVGLGRVITGAFPLYFEISVSIASVALFGALLIFRSVYSKRYRAIWLYRLLMSFGVAYLMIFPIGTLLGSVFLIVASSKRDEFYAGLPNTISR
jgi:hypothetical protein